MMVNTNLRPIAYGGAGTAEVDRAIYDLARGYEQDRVMIDGRAPDRTPDQAFLANYLFHMLPTIKHAAFEKRT